MTATAARTVLSLSAPTKITLQARGEYDEPQAGVNEIELDESDSFSLIRISKRRVIVQVYVSEKLRYLIVNTDLDIQAGGEQIDLPPEAKIRAVASQDGRPALLASYPYRVNGDCPISFPLQKGDCCECEIPVSEHKRERLIFTLLDIAGRRAIFNAVRKRSQIKTTDIRSLIVKPTR